MKGVPACVQHSHPSTQAHFHPHLLSAPHLYLAPCLGSCLPPWVVTFPSLADLSRQLSEVVGFPDICQGHSSLDAPSELNPPQRIPSLFMTLLVPQAEG